MRTKNHLPKITLSIALCVFLSCSLLGQTPDFNWAKSFAGTQDQTGNSIVRDSLGNYYSAGRFTGTVDFDPGPGVVQLTSVGGISDAYVMKQDSFGNLLWVKQLEGNAQETCNKVEIDHEGNVYVVGAYTGSIDLNPGTAVESTVTTGFYDAFILKLTSAGDYLWSKHIGGTEMDSFADIEVDQQNNVIVSGVYTGTVDVDPGPLTIMKTCPGGYSNGIVLKFTPSGNLMFANAFDSGFLSVVNYVKVNSANEIIVQGIFTDSCDLDPGMTTYTINAPSGSHSLFVCKLNNSGDFVWGKSIPLSLNGPLVWHPDMNVDDEDNIVLAGQFTGTCDFDPGAGVQNLTAAAGNGFLLKLNTNGNFVWVKNLTATSQMVVQNVASDDDGSIYVAGFIQGQVDFDPGPGSHYAGNAQDANPYYGYVVKYTSSGAFVWVYSALEMYPTELTVFDDKIALTGSFRTTVDFDPTTDNHSFTSLGGYDIFVCEWTSNCFNYIAPEVVTSCADYTWAKNNQVYNNSGTYSHVVENVNGCDSIFTLELTIPVVAVSMDFDTTLCDTSAAFVLNVATPAGGTYEINGTPLSILDPGTLTPGVYSLIYTVEQDNCPFSDTADFSVIHCSGLSVGSVEENTFECYPNPTTGLVYYSNVGDFDSIKVVDVTGKSVRAQVNAQMIDLSELADGLYTIIVQYPNYQRCVKVVLDK